MSSVELGIGLRGDTPDAGRLARLAEDSGFAVVTAFSDLGYGPPHPLLLDAAATTTRVRLGVACYNPYTDRPAAIADEVAALDAATGGRAYFGLARGAWLDTIGVAQPRPLETLRQAASLIERRLPRRVPLLIGGWGPRIVALAGEIADELKVGGSANPDLVPVMRERLGNGSTAIVFGAVTVVDEDRDAARALARQRAAMYIDVVARLDPTVDISRVGGDELLDRFAFAGTPADVTRQVRLLFDAGVHRVEFGVPFGLNSESGLRLLGERVVPNFVSRW